MHWKDTLIDFSKVQWQPITTVCEDGKIDVDIHLPLTDLIHIQAKQSFSQGIVAWHEFMTKFAEMHEADPEANFKELWDKQVKEWGL